MSPPEDARPETGNWPHQAVDRLDHLVSMVRDRAVKPLTTVARALVFGIVVAVMGVGALVLVTIGIVRLIDVYLFPTRIWATYALVGAFFFIIGSFLWTKRRPRQKGAT